jgi:hypothetical protein
VIPEFYKDSEWTRLLAMADPAIDPHGEKGAAIRGSVNWVLLNTYALFRRGTLARDPGKSLATYADAGERFIHGMRMLDLHRADLEMLLAHWDMRPARELRSLFDEGLAKRIEQLCVLFRLFAKVGDADGDEDMKTGPNSKPWLHIAVHVLYDLWRDELGQGERPKKDFLAFAFAVLGPLKIGITENSILESFDRHVRHTKDFRHRMRQTGPI